ncbi:ion transporter [uncultured Roseibium sp.]|uniref:ion transporter n=1 Tax=uncultured Roseibium sp. TaxID=1936171 RepID=UPI002596C1E1|nr:ion transporter [uncultured Roseibium sp.]
MAWRRLSWDERYRIERLGLGLTLLALGLLVLASVFSGESAEGQDLTEFLRLLKGAILAVVALEVLLRFLLEGWRFFRWHWNIYHLTVVVLAIGLNAPAILVFRLVAIIGWPGVVARWRRLAFVFRWGRRLLRELLLSLCLLVSVFCAVAVLAVDLLGHRHPVEFGSFIRACDTLLRLCLFDLASWYELLALAERDPLVWLLVSLFWMVLLVALINPPLGLFFAELAQTKIEQEEMDEDLSEMRLMRLESELVSKEIAVEAEAERLLIRRETERILQQIEKLKQEMAHYRESQRRFPR